MLLLTQIEGKANRPRLSQGDPTQPTEDVPRDPPLETSPGRWPGREVALAAPLTHRLTPPITLRVTFRAQLNSRPGIQSGD